MPTRKSSICDFCEEPLQFLLQANILLCCQCISYLVMAILYYQGPHFCRFMLQFLIKSLLSIECYMCFCAHPCHVLSKTSMSSGNTEKKILDEGVTVFFAKNLHINILSTSLLSCFCHSCYFLFLHSYFFFSIFKV